jgi:hypothetical protein
MEDWSFEKRMKWLDKIKTGFKKMVADFGEIPTEILTHPSMASQL